MKKKIKYLTFSIFICFVLFWIGSIIKCEVVTALYGKEFQHFEVLSMAESFKILEYDKDYAKIYFITRNRESGSIHSYIKVDGEWTFNKWEDGGWSRQGSADGFVWPYIR